jgi:hypothetical protein
MTIPSLSFGTASPGAGEAHGTIEDMLTRRRAESGSSAELVLTGHAVKASRHFWI